MLAVDLPVKLMVVSLVWHTQIHVLVNSTFENVWWSIIDMTCCLYLDFDVLGSSIHPEINSAGDSSLSTDSFDALRYSGE